MSEQWTITAVKPTHLPGTARLVVTEGPHRLKVGESVEVVPRTEVERLKTEVAQWKKEARELGRLHEERSREVVTGKAEVERLKEDLAEVERPQAPERVEVKP